MSRFLDIIIPHYNEPDEMVSDVISSIAKQHNIIFDEIGVIFVDNASTIPTEKSFFEKWPNLHVDLITLKENVGPGGASQAGLDYSRAEYVTFVDCDDELYGTEALGRVINYIKNNSEENVFTSLCKEQVFDENGVETFFVHDDQSLSSMHGMFCKRQFLLDNEIGFYDKIRYFHDSYFIACVYEANQCRIRINEITYFWKFNRKSAVRKDRTYNVHVEHFYDFQNVYRGVLDYMKKHKISIKNENVVKLIYGEVLFLGSELFDYDELKDKKERFLEETRRFYEEYKYAWNELSEEEIKQCENIELKSLNRSTPILKHVDLQEVLYGIKKKQHHFLDIILVHTNETEEDIKRFLDSLNKQKKVNLTEIGVIIVNNRSKILIRKGIFKNYPKLDIDYYRTDECVSVGKAFQYGIDKSESDYITFMYCSDEIYEKECFNAVLEYLKRHLLNSLFTANVEKYFVDKKENKLMHTLSDMMSLRGLIVSRETLNKNNIRFSEQLNYFEDVYFIHKLLTVVYYESYETPICLWEKKANAKNRCRYVDYIDDYIKLRMELVNMISSVNGPVAQYLLIGLFSACVFINSHYFEKAKANDEKKKYINQIKKIYLDNIDVINTIPEEAKKQIYMGQIVTLQREYPDLKYVDMETLLGI